MSFESFSTSMNGLFPVQIPTTSDIHHSAPKLNELNDRKALALLPCILFLAIVMIGGFLGNILVCYFYGWKVRSSTPKVFILGLALLDLMTTCLSIPMEIMDLRFFYDFPSTAACKILRTVNYVCSFGSGILLVAIAIDRYRRLCKPFTVQITLTGAKAIVGLSLLVSFLIAWPSIIFYDIIEVPIYENLNSTLIGYDCTTVKDNGYSSIIFARDIFYMVIFVLGATCLTVLYCMIAMKMKKEYRTRSEVKSTRSGNTINNKNVIYPVDAMNLPQNSVMEDGSKAKQPVATISDTSFDSLPLERKIQHESSGASELQSKIYEDGDDQNEVEINSRSHTEETTRTAEIRNVHAVKKMKSVRNIASRRFNSIMLTVTIAFIMSFLPYLSVIGWRSATNNYRPATMNIATQNVYDISMRSYLVNSIINPIVYGFFNPHFKRFLCSILKKVLPCRKGVG